MIPLVLNVRTRCVRTAYSKQNVGVEVLSGFVLTAGVPPPADIMIYQAKVHLTAFLEAKRS